MKFVGRPKDEDELMKNKILILFFSILFMMSLGGIGSPSLAKGIASSTAKQVLFKKSYDQYCAGLKQVPARDRKLFCKCMLKKYVSSGYTDVDTLKIIKKIYDDTLKTKGLSDYESLVVNFDASSVEECLEEVSKK